MAVAPSGRRPVRRKPDDLGNEHRDRLAEHRGLRLDAAHSPAEHAQSVDHRGVGIGAHHRIGKGASASVRTVREHHSGEILEIDLVDDAGIGRHHQEVLESLLSPAQKGVAFAVSLELDFGVGRERAGTAEGVDLHRVVYDQFRRRQRVDLPRVAAEFPHRVAHRGEIDEGGNPGEVLQDHPGGVNAISVAGWVAGSQPASAAMSSALTFVPSSWRSRFSSRILSE